MRPGGLALRFALRPKVVHRLPGRLRIHVRALKGLPEDLHAVGEMVASLLVVPDGIESADPCFETGNILLHYDPDTVEERDVLGYFHSLLKILVRHRDRLEKVPADRLPEVAERLRQHVRGSIQHRLVLDGNLEIPENVLE